MTCKATSSSISYSNFSADTILSLVSLDNIETGTKTEAMKALKTNLESIRNTITNDLQAFQALVDKHIPQIEDTSNPTLEGLKFKAIVQTFEHGCIESTLFNELVSAKLIENNQFILPEVFDITPVKEEPQQKPDNDETAIFRVRTSCYDSFVKKLQLLNRYTHELTSALDHLDNSHVNQDTRPYLTTLFRTLDMTREGSPILEKFQEVFNKYSGIKSGFLDPYLQKRDETKAALTHLKNHTLQRGLDIISRCDHGVLLLTLSAAISKALRYSTSSPKELDVLSSNEPYIEELNALSSLDIAKAEATTHSPIQSASNAPSLDSSTTSGKSGKKK